MLDTMRDLVGIESGSKDVEGVERIAALVRDRLAALGGKAEIIQPAQVFRLDDTPRRSAPWCGPSSWAAATRRSC